VYVFGKVPYLWRVKHALSFDHQRLNAIDLGTGGLRSFPEIDRAVGVKSEFGGVVEESGEPKRHLLGG
jgi:hypothetical protein